MPYTVDRFSDNGFDIGWPVSIADESVDNTTSLSLLGRGVTNYGELIAEDLVHLLENFAGSDSPQNPITGQLWFEANPGSPGQGVLKVYNGNEFVPISTTPTGNSLPTSNNEGDLFYLITGENNRLYIHDGTEFNLASGMILSPSLPGNPNYGDLWWDESAAPPVVKMYTPNNWERIQTGNDAEYASGSFSGNLVVDGTSTFNGASSFNDDVEFNGNVKFNGFVAFSMETITSNKTLVRQVTRCNPGVTAVTMPPVAIEDEGRFITIINNSGVNITVNAGISFDHDGAVPTWSIPVNATETFWLTRNAPPSAPGGNTLVWSVATPVAVYDQ